MAKDYTTAGIDLGTSHIKVMIVRFEEDLEKGGKLIPKIIGTGTAVTRGMRRGYVEDVSELSASLKNALGAAQKAAGVEIRQAQVAVGDAGLKSFTAVGDTIVTKADLEITELDIAKASENSEESLSANAVANKRIIHRIPIASKIDGKQVFDNHPVGMKGSKLEIKSMFVAALLPHLSRVARAVENNDIEIIDMIASPIAASVPTLTKSQKMAGCILVNIGAETTSIIVYEDNLPVSLEVLPLGGQDITNDIALGLKISIEEAESIKIGAMTPSTVSRKKLDEIIEARLSDIFELIETHLKKINRNQMLPAGIFLTGGGAKILGLEVMAKNFLKLSAKVVSIPSGTPGKTLEPIWSVAYGLCMLDTPDQANGNGKNIGGFSETFKKILNSLKKFLP